MKKEDALKELDEIWYKVSELKEDRLDLKFLLAEGKCQTEIDEKLNKMAYQEMKINEKVLKLRIAIQ